MSDYFLKTCLYLCFIASKKTDICSDGSCDHPKLNHNIPEKIQGKCIYSFANEIKYKTECYIESCLNVAEKGSFEDIQHLKQEFIDSNILNDAYYICKKLDER